MAQQERSRRFGVGMEGRLPDGAVHYRVGKGAHGPHDLVLMLRTEGWVRVPMSLGCLEADFFHENEDAINPPSRWCLGGAFYMRRLDLAVREGWRVAADQTNRERTARERGDRAALRVVSDPPQACPACGQTDRFWKRESSAMWVCAVCDPIEERFPS